MTTVKPTFEVSKEGLAKLLERRGGKAFAVTELVQNAWDENSTRVDVWLTAAPTRGLYKLTVEDDNPEGFIDLTHAYTLFAESLKKGDAEKRGRFNLGEKFVIAVATEATVETTTGTVRFDEHGRTHSRAIRDSGSLFTCYLRLTKAEVAEIDALVRSLLPPAGITTTYNGEPLTRRTPLASFTAKLLTEYADADGVLRRTVRNTKVDVHKPLPGETASLYELGIPVVGTGDQFHVDIQQKVPLNLDRDNVTPAYLRAVRAETLNHAHQFLADEDADATWITEALSDDRIEAEALGAALDKRFGDKRVVFDPSDHEANKRAVAAGYTVIAPRSLPKGVAAVAREAGVLQAAGAVTPSPRPYGDGDERLTKPRDQWSDAEARMAEYANALAERLLGHGCEVVIVNDPKCQNFRATWRRGGLSASIFADLPIKVGVGGACLELNLRQLGKRWFEAGPTVPANALLIHEFAHDLSSDHLSDDYYDACCTLGAKLAQLALDDPAFFARYMVESSEAVAR